MLKENCSKMHLKKSWFVNMPDKGLGWIMGVFLLKGLQ